MLRLKLDTFETKPDERGYASEINRGDKLLAILATHPGNSVSLQDLLEVVVDDLADTVK